MAKLKPVRDTVLEGEPRQVHAVTLFLVRLLVSLSSEEPEISLRLLCRHHIRNSAPHWSERKSIDSRLYPIRKAPRRTSRRSILSPRQSNPFPAPHIHTARLAHSLLRLGSTIPRGLRLNPNRGAVSGKDFVRAILMELGRQRVANLLKGRFMPLCG